MRVSWVLCVLLATLFSSAKATPGSVFFNQGGTAYKYQLPGLKPASSSISTTVIKAPESKSKPDVILLNADSDEETDSVVAASEPRKFRASLRSKQDDKESEGGLPLAEYKDEEYESEEDNETINSQEKILRRKASKKRARRLPLCRNLRWPYVTASRSMPCISDQELRAMAVGKSDLDEYFDGPRLLPRPLSPASGISPPRPRFLVPPPDFEDNYIQEPPPQTYSSYNSGGSGWTSKPTYGPAYPAQPPPGPFQGPNGAPPPPQGPLPNNLQQPPVPGAQQGAQLGVPQNNLGQPVGALIVPQAPGLGQGQSQAGPTTVPILNPEGQSRAGFGRALYQENPSDKCESELARYRRLVAVLLKRLQDQNPNVQIIPRQGRQQELPPPQNPNPALASPSPVNPGNPTFGQASVNFVTPAPSPANGSPAPVPQSEFDQNQQLGNGAPYPPVQNPGLPPQQNLGGPRLPPQGQGAPSDPQLAAPPYGPPPGVDAGYGGSPPHPGTNYPPPGGEFQGNFYPPVPVPPESPPQNSPNDQNPEFGALPQGPVANQQPQQVTYPILQPPAGEAAKSGRQGKALDLTNNAQLGNQQNQLGNNPQQLYTPNQIGQPLNPYSYAQPQLQQQQGFQNPQGVNIPQVQYGQPPPYSSNVYGPPSAPVGYAFGYPPANYQEGGPDGTSASQGNQNWGWGQDDRKQLHGMLPPQNRDIRLQQQLQNQGFSEPLPLTSGNGTAVAEGAALAQANGTTSVRATSTTSSSSVVQGSKKVEKEEAMIEDLLRSINLAELERALLSADNSNSKIFNVLSQKNMTSGSPKSLDTVSTPLAQKQSAPAPAAEDNNKDSSPIELPLTKQSEASTGSG